MDRTTILPESKYEIILELKSHYENLKKDLDQDVGLELFKEMDRITVRNEIAIKMDQSFESNIAKIDEFSLDFTPNETEIVKTKALNSYCYYLKNRYVDVKLKQTNGIGLFILADWYMDANQINFIRSYTFQKLYLKFFCFNLL